MRPARFIPYDQIPRHNAEEEHRRHQTPAGPTLGRLPPDDPQGAVDYLARKVSQRGHLGRRRRAPEGQDRQRHYRGCGDGFGAASEIQKSVYAAADVCAWEGTGDAEAGCVEGAYAGAEREGGEGEVVEAEGVA